MGHLTPNNRRRNTMRDLFKPFFDDDFYSNLPDVLTPNFNHMSMRADIKETNKEYIIEAEMPGFNKDEIDISVDSGYIIIKADKRNEVSEERQGYIRKERRYGHVQRSFKLHNIEEDSITAKYENGILKVTLPKSTDGKDNGRRIDIQ
ncbi:Hsp20/alpha crystallin family protein [Caldisalinibacter kiritimatiensis]|uniref:Heat shock protein Hsp20 n=1 Tax=Caldisalinibacter kiritimatiensis TaxID=1304284 RepID=R1ASF1_9FIRM|nr:Hsp20/alpha crystallin family protein [Caldisalinibacter kiritimatiensis]EOC99581.1 heat shock protein Hsp20 [Caldisalinibacter kiritimatiensis]